MFLLPALAARDWKSGASNLMDVNARPLNEWAVNTTVDEQWLGSNGKDYGPAVRRWEEITGHPAPCPSEPGTKGNRRLSPAFSEWMMGVEPGHVTDIVTDRNDALHVIGNGVVPRQAEAAFRFLMDDENWTDSMSEETTHPEPVKAEKPRGKCPGCAFDYQLGTARTGEHKGKLVIRKHNSRTGPGLCSGAYDVPESEHGTPPRTNEGHCEQGACTGCCGCSSMCTTDPCGQPPFNVVGVRRDAPEARYGLMGDVVGVAPGGTPVVAAPTDLVGAIAADPFTAPLPYAVSHDRTDTGDGGDPGVQPPQVHPGNGVPGVDGVAGRARLRTDHGGASAGEGAPADVPALGGGDPRGAVDRSSVQEHDLRGPGSPGSGHAVGEHTSAVGGYGARERAEDALPQGAPVRREQHPVRIQGGGTGVSSLPGGVQPPVPAPTEDPFVSPGPMSDIPTATITVSGQPEPDRDQYGRYLLPVGGKRQAHTRATTFAKLGANTKAIEAWNERNVIRGLTLRPDLLMLANGLEVKRDRDTLNSIASQAKDAAGSKVAANIGTAYHAFSERIDAGLHGLEAVPDAYRERVHQYVATVRGAGLTTRPEWIERTTAVRADQVGAPLPVAGTLDRIFQLPDGSLVIGDLKTGSDLSYGEMEIEVQLALYAHGVNTHGLFDWNTKTWETLSSLPERSYGVLTVRTDIAIVVHLPADGDSCTLYVADIERGWRDAQRLGPLQASLKEKSRFRTLTAADLAPRATHQLSSPEYLATRTEQMAPVAAPIVSAPLPETDPWGYAVDSFRTARDKDHLAKLYEVAVSLGFHQDQLAVLVGLGKDRLNELARG